MKLLCHRILQFILLLLAVKLIIIANRKDDMNAMILGLCGLIFDCVYFSSTNKFIKKEE